MKFFKERKTPLENIAFIALMSAVNAVIDVLATLVPGSALIVVLFLPLISALSALLCDKKYLWLYLLAAPAVSLAVSAYDMQTTFFYVWPAIFSGTLYGLLIKKKFPLPYVVLLVSFLALGLNYLAIPIIQAIYGNNIITTSLTVLGLSNRKYIFDIVPTFLFGYSLASVALSHFLIQGVFLRLDIPYTENSKFEISYPIGGFCMGFLAIGLAFVQRPLAYLSLALCLYFSANSVPLLFHKSKWYIYVSGGVLFLLALYFFAFFYKSFPEDGGLTLAALFFLPLDILPFFERILLLKGAKTPLE